MTAERARITIFDTTLRDGEQSPGCSMNLPEKLRLAQQLERLGVDVIEAGFPIASDGDFESVKAIATVIRRPIIAGLARACQADIERAWEALKYAARPRIHVFLATSDIHLQYKLRITRDQCLAQAREAIRLEEQLVRAEQIRLAEGLSTSYNVILIERDLLAAQLAEVQAHDAYAKARVTLDQAMGVTLEKSHVSLDAALKED